MIDNDIGEKERVDARNALEEYVYDMREKLGEDGPLAPFIVTSERESIINLLNDLENWLYEEGEDCEKDVYRSKLNNLHTLTDPIKARSIEYEQQPNEFNHLGHTIQMSRKAVHEYRDGSAKYDHLTETEILNISEAADKAQRWHDDHIAIFNKTNRMTDPQMLTSDIRHETQTLNTCMNSVLNRPKPKPPTPPAAEPAAPNAASAPGSGAAGDKTGKDEPTAEPTLKEDQMDVE